MDYLQRVKLSRSDGTGGAVPPPPFSPILFRSLAWFCGGVKIALMSFVNLNEDDSNNMEINVFEDAEGHFRFDYHNG